MYTYTKEMNEREPSAESSYVPTLQGLERKKKKKLKPISTPIDAIFLLRGHPALLCITQRKYPNGSDPRTAARDSFEEPSSKRAQLLEPLPQRLRVHALGDDLRRRGPLLVRSPERREAGYGARLVDPKVPRRQGAASG